MATGAARTGKRLVPRLLPFTTARVSRCLTSSRRWKGRSRKMSTFNFLPAVRNPDERRSGYGHVLHLDGAGCFKAVLACAEIAFRVRSRKRANHCAFSQDPEFAGFNGFQERQDWTKADKWVSSSAPSPFSVSSVANKCERG